MKDFEIAADEDTPPEAIAQDLMDILLAHPGMPFLVLVNGKPLGVVVYPREDQP